METLPVRVLVVEDYQQFRRFVCSTLGKNPELQIIGEVSDGLEAVHKAEDLQPDLIVLDIGLPSLNGIEAARRIRTLSPESKILFVSQEGSTDVVQGAFAAGARGYVLKTDAASELLQAVRAILRGEQFVGRRFSAHNFVGVLDVVTSEDWRIETAVAPVHRSVDVARRHDVGFYSDDAGLLDRLTGFIGPALSVGNAAIVIATESHRDSLLLRLQTTGLDIGAAIEEGRYIALDAADALAKFMVNGLPDRILFLMLLGNLVAEATEVARGEEARVAIFGECVELLCAQGNLEAAIQVEKLGNQLAKEHDLDILCGYNLRTVHSSSHISEQICAEHSAVIRGDWLRHARSKPS